MSKREWYASGKERKPGRLLLYTLIAVVGVTFAVLAVALIYFSGGNLGKSLWMAFLGALIAAAIGVVIYLIYMAVARRR